MPIPQLLITDTDGSRSRQGVAGETGSQVLAEAKRIVRLQNEYAVDIDYPGLTVADWEVQVNGQTVFSQTIEDARARAMELTR